jgi:hypothetical protein
MQIVQFLFGASYAALHSFVSYTIPIQVSSLATSAAKVASAVATSATDAALDDLSKQGTFQAAGGEEVVNTAYSHQQGSPESAIEHHTGYQTVSCINTSGQTFAIWFNVLYLTPLTVLFLRFFVKAYFQSQKGGKRSPEKRH